jgi:hypothetical protein
MNHAALEHILRATAAVADERDFVVTGSQADIYLAGFQPSPI